MQEPWSASRPRGDLRGALVVAVTFGGCGRRVMRCVRNCSRCTWKSGGALSRPRRSRLFQPSSRLLIRRHGGPDLLQQRPLLHCRFPGLLGRLARRLGGGPRLLSRDASLFSCVPERLRLHSRPLGPAAAGLGIGAIVFRVLSHPLGGVPDRLSERPLFLCPLAFLLGRP